MGKIRLGKMDYQVMKLPSKKIQIDFFKVNFITVIAEKK